MSESTHKFNEMDSQTHVTQLPNPKINPRTSRVPSNNKGLSIKPPKRKVLHEDESSSHNTVLATSYSYTNKEYNNNKEKIIQ